MLSMLSFFYFRSLNNHFTKCVFAYPYSPMYPYYDPIGVGKVNKLFYWLTGGFPSEEGLNRVGSWNHPLWIVVLFVLFFCSIRIYFLFIDSDVIPEKENLLTSMTIYVWAENPGPNAGNSVNQLPLPAVPCKTKTDGSPLARGAFTRLSFSPVIT